MTKTQSLITDFEVRIDQSQSSLKTKSNIRPDREWENEGDGGRDGGEGGGGHGRGHGLGHGPGHGGSNVKKPDLSKLGKETSEQELKQNAGGGHYQKLRKTRNNKIENSDIKIGNKTPTRCLLKGGRSPQLNDIRNFLNESINSKIDENGPKIPLRKGLKLKIVENFEHHGGVEMMGGGMTGCNPKGPV